MEWDYESERLREKKRERCGERGKKGRKRDVDGATKTKVGEGGTKAKKF